MARVALIGDSHFDESSRWEECVRVHDWIADDIRERGVDLVLHSGDVYERRSSPKERTAVAAWLRKVADVAPVMIVRGNHDAPGDLKLLERLWSKNPIIVEEAAGVHVNGVAVGCLAWPTKARIHAFARPDSHEEGEQLAGDLLRNVLRGLGQQMAAHDGPRVLLAHAMVRGSRVSTGQPLVGCDLEIGLEDLALATADAYLLGHIHMPQEWEIGGTPTLRGLPVIYPGSPRRTAFGEVEEKGYVLLDTATLMWERVPTPCAEMLLITGRMADTECAETGADMRALVVSENPVDVTGAEIRLRYQADRDERDRAKAEAEGWRQQWLGRGAEDVRLEEVVIATTTARAPEIARAPTLAAKLKAYWAAKGEELDEARETRLLGHVAELEGEAA